MSEHVVRLLARCKGFDLELEDRGHLILKGCFYYEGQLGVQGLGYEVDAVFLKRFLRAIGVYELQQVNGRSCWVTVIDGTVRIIEPLHAEDGTRFDIREWVKEKEAEANRE